MSSPKKAAAPQKVLGTSVASPEKAAGLQEAKNRINAALHEKCEREFSRV